MAQEVTTSDNDKHPLQVDSGRYVTEEHLLRLVALERDLRLANIQINVAARLNELELEIRKALDPKHSQHVIDCDAAPFVPSVPSGLSGVEEHVNGGKLVWEESKIELYLDDGQKGEGRIQGYELRKVLKDKRVLNANVLDYLLAHPELIPESWKGKTVFFWGTIYPSSVGGRFVRCLCWFDGRWCSGGCWLDYGWGSGFPAALLAS